MNDTQTTASLKNDTKAIVNDENHDDHHDDTPSIRSKEQTGAKLPGLASPTKTASAQTSNTELSGRTRHEKQHLPITQTHIDASWAAHPRMTKEIKMRHFPDMYHVEESELSFQSVDSREISRVYHEIEKELFDSNETSSDEEISSSEDWLPSYLGNVSVPGGEDVFFIEKGLSRLELEEEN